MSSWTRLILKCALLAIVIPALLSIAGCERKKTVGEKELAERAPHNWVVLLDVSDSTASNRPIYKQALARVADQISYRDHCSAYSIAKYSQIGSREITASVVDLPADFERQLDKDNDFQRRGRVIQFEDQRAAQRSAFVSALETALSTGDSGAGNDILGAIDIASSEFATGAPDIKTRVLVITSDMELSLDKIDLRKPGFDKDKALALVAQKNLIPRLDGVTVVVVGAGGADHDHWAKIKAFWLDYFAKTGAAKVHYSNDLSPDVAKTL
jgi:hypothetical protein